MIQTSTSDVVGRDRAHYFRGQKNATVHALISIVSHGHLLHAVPQKPFEAEYERHRLLCGLVRQNARLVPEAAPQQPDDYYLRVDPHGVEDHAPQTPRRYDDEHGHHDDRDHHQPSVKLEAERKAPASKSLSQSMYRVGLAVPTDKPWKPRS